MILEYIALTNIGSAKFSFDDDKQIVVVHSSNEDYNFTATYDLIDKLHEQLEDIRSFKEQDKND